jgi:uncharacterized protein YcbK (DUF882 family)
LKSERDNRVPSSFGRCAKTLASAGLATGMMAVMVTESGNAVANGDTRSISIYHTHSRESATITFKRNGQFDRDGLEKLNWILRDWRTQQPTSMDPRLFDVVWEVHRAVDSNDPFNIVSAYRSPETNAMLRRRSSGVAEHSQHMLGKAMDFFLPDTPLPKVREAGLRLQRGGVGFYPTSFSPFVHLDVGGVRHWPRMTREQLARVFPDGKTVHIPTDGKPMPGYQLALAEIQANGGTAPVTIADAGQPTLGRKSFFAALFGGGGGSDEDDDQTPAGKGGARSGPQQVASAYAPTGTGKGDTHAFFLQEAQRGSGTPADGGVPVQGEAAAAAPRYAFAKDGKAAAAVPVPLARPSDLAPPQPQGGAQVASLGQQMVWQPGPQGAEDPAARYAMVPVPPRRPDELVTAAVGGAVPLPPARPNAVAALLPAGASLAPLSQGAELTSGPDSATGSLAYSAVPLPPSRPTQRAVAERPAADAGFVRALFVPASTAPVAPQGGVTLARAKAVARDHVPYTAPATATIVAAFRVDAASDLATDHFTGPAVKALPVAMFVSN